MVLTLDFYRRIRMNRKGVFYLNAALLTLIMIALGRMLYEGLYSPLKQDKHKSVDTSPAVGVP
jgi:hypothetical protein